jgi:hypothetical protein
MPPQGGPTDTVHSLPPPRPLPVRPANNCEPFDTFRLFPAVTNLAMKMLNITPDSLMGCNLREHLDFLLEVFPPSIVTLCPTNTISRMFYKFQEH